MNPTKIIGGAAFPPISTKCFPFDEIIKVAVKPHEEHVKGFEQQGQVGCPLRFLKDVFQQEIIAGRGIGDERAMEPFEKAIVVFRPLEVALPEPTHRQHFRIANMIDGNVPEWLGDLCLNHTRQRGFAAAGRTMNEDDFGSFFHL